MVKILAMMPKKPFRDFILEIKSDKSLNVFAREVGVRLGTVQNWLNRNGIPKEDALRKLSAYSGVPVYRILEEYHVPEYSTRMAQLASQNKVRASEADEFIHIPFLGSAGCGNANAIQGEPISFIKRSKREFKKLYGDSSGWIFVEASGTSMSPTIQDGALVLVDTEKTGYRDGVFLLIENEDALIKRCLFGRNGMISVTSDNPNSRAQDFEFNLKDIDVTITIVGRVKASEMVVS